MCGIAGMLWRKGAPDPTLLSRMTDRISHRGPDSSGHWSDPAAGIHLGHRRLSIIDLSERGNQPMTNETGRIRMICNGEIYNYRDLRAQLEAAGHAFYSDCDSEIIVHAYEAWGSDCFSHFNGMFAIALWDPAIQTLLLARDHLGVKPLLYLPTAQGVFFSSEAKSFLELPPEVWRPSFDEPALEHLLTFQFLTDPAMCLLKGVRKVKPGHVIAIRQDSLREDAFWTLKRQEAMSALTFEQAVQECEARLLRSVELQMQADVPVGILLSGGLDSSLVAALAAQKTSLPVHTFTAGFEHRWDERPHAAAVARHIGSVHTEILINPREISDRIEKLIYYFDDLSSLDGGLFTTILMTEQIRPRGVKVLLVGEGADEAFAGYSWYGLSCLPYRLLPARIRTELFSYTLSRLLPTSRARRRTADRVHRILAGANEPDICRQIHRFDLLHELPSHFLMKVDHGTMANSIEARVPYLDTDLVEFAYSLPREYKFEGAWFHFDAVQEKRILREVAKRYLPEDIRGRKKRGFSIPVPEMLLSNRDKVRGYLLDPSSLARSLYTASQIEKMLAFKPSFYSPLEKDKEFMVWKLFLLEVWSRHYLRAAPAPALAAKTP